jgi:hypothetical protein
LEGQVFEVAPVKWEVPEFGAVLVDLAWKAVFLKVDLEFGELRGDLAWLG